MCVLSSDVISATDSWTGKEKFSDIILYILEFNPRPFLQFQRSKKSDADYNRVLILFAVESWILEKW
jgi:hypothetical protein